MSQYIPENPYLSTNYTPIKEFKEDLCTRCEKYYKMLHESGITKKPFPPNCEKHIQNKILALDPQDFESQEEYEEATVILDPIAWAKAEFGWEPRFYQDDIISCTAKFKLLRQGRRSGKTIAMIIDMLHHVTTNKNHTVIVVAPYEKQVTHIFDEAIKLIQSGVTIKGSLSRRTMTPSRLEFHNGSKVLGFSSGPNSSSGSVKIRGSDAHYIIVDEMDYLNDDDIDAIMAILASHPDCKLTVASTPAGWRKKFFTFATDKNLTFKEFWFIAAENPTWTAEMEDFFKATFQDSYGHEFLADFLELEDGVFKSRFINKALADYDMNESSPVPGADYIMGVDWNKAAGNHMVILEWAGGKLRLVKKIIISESQYTHTDSVQMIITLNRVWRFKYIFVDRGYGATSVELLRKHTLVEPSSMLDSKLVDIAMNQNIDIIDPLTGNIVGRQAKHFLIEHTRKLLEDERIILPKSEDTVANAENRIMGLVQQMRNFRVEGISTYGLPKYSQGQDHTLTAFYLACGAFYWKEGDLKSVPYSSTLVGIEISDEVNKYIHPSLIEREEETRKGYVLRRTNNKQMHQKSLHSRELPSGQRRGLRQLRNDIETRRNSSMSKRPDMNYRRKSF